MAEHHIPAFDAALAEFSARMGNLADRVEDAAEVLAAWEAAEVRDRRAGIAPGRHVPAATRALQAALRPDYPPPSPGPL